MPCKCEIGCIDKSLPRKGFLGGEIPAWERFTGQRNHRLGKVSWADESLPRKVYWKMFSSLERFPGQRNLCPGNVYGKNSLAKKPLAGKGILERGISAQDRLLGKVLFIEKVSWAYKFLPGKGFWEEFSRVDQIGVECKIRKLFPEPAKMGNFSRMEYPRILRNIHPWSWPSQVLYINIEKEAEVS